MTGLDAQGNLVCQPLNNLKDVIEWNTSCFEFCVQPTRWTNNVGRQFQDNIDGEIQPKILLCHDMKGGYLDDRFLQGSDNSEAYRFYHWHLIDTFVYFSHHFITVPPEGWIRAAHRNGVQILGTIITEWEDGAQICQELLKTRENIERVATKLADIAFVFGFDGWLVNIENIIEEKSIPDLQYFVQQLTYHCHNRLKDAAKVLWYDSVTHAGSLDWQNELNDKNELFFSVCDGIFLNYAITEEKLANSKQVAQTTNRCFDVYVGVDVFGRATPGGGGFNCKQVLDMISKQTLSCAIFAPGWVYEVHGAEKFDDNEMKFWKLLKDFLPRRSHTVPLRTSFCQGFGHGHYCDGKVTSGVAWHNLSLQQLQPCYGDSDGVSLSTSDAFNGGGCLKLSSSSTSEASVFRLFKLSLDKREEPLIVTATWKENGCNLPCGLCFVLVACEKDCPGIPSGKAAVLTHESGSDKDVHEGFWGKIFDKGANKISSKNKPSLQFVSSMTLKETDSSGWISSQWNVDISWLYPEQSCSLRHQSAMLYAVLLPRTNIVNQEPQTDQSVLLGKLEIEWKKSSEFCTVQQACVIDNLTCLDFKTCEPISKQKLLAVHNEIEDLKKARDNEPSKEACNTSISSNSKDSTGISDSEVSTSFASNQVCLYKRCQTIPEDVDGAGGNQPISLHFLNWSSNSSDKVDYYMVFTVDENGSEQFVGFACTNSFVVRLDQVKLSSSVVGYFIKPVLDNEALLGQKFIISSL